MIAFTWPSAAEIQIIRKGTKPTVSFIGFGSFASHTLFPIVKELYELNGVAVTNPLKAKELAKEGFKFATTDYNEILEKEEDIIIIATRHSQHYPILRDAITKSKARIIYVEKPPVLTPEQLEDINELLKEHKKFVVTGFNRPCSPISQLLKEVVKGKKASLVCRVAAGRLKRDHWVYQPEEGGRYLGEGCHFVDYAVFLFGRPVKGSAVFLTPDNVKVIDTDVWSASMAFDDGLATIHYTSLNSKETEKENIELHAEGTTVRVYDYVKVVVEGEEKEKWLERCLQLCSRYSPQREGNTITMEKAKGWREEMEQLGKLLKTGDAGCLATWDRAYVSMRALFDMYY